MTGLSILHILKVYSTLAALNFVVAMPKGLPFPGDASLSKNAEPIGYSALANSSFQREINSLYDQADQPKNCFHFYVSHNMSALLSEATKMLRQVRDRREREWILTFIYRIKSLSEHLRSHPESRNYECLSNEAEIRKRTSILSDRIRAQQPELYFVDDLPVPHNQKRAAVAPDSFKDAYGDEIRDQSLQDTQDLGEKVEANTRNNDADNQQSHRVVTNSWKEQSLPSIPPSEEVENLVNLAERTLPSKSEEESGEQEGASDNSDPSPAVAGTAHSELTRTQKDSMQSMPDKNSSTAEQNIEAQSNGDNHVQSLPHPKPSYENAILISSTADCETNIHCNDDVVNRRHSASDYQASDDQEEDLLVQELHSGHDSYEEEDRNQQRTLKKRIRKALLEDMAPEVKKLRIVGGSEKDLIDLWNMAGKEIAKTSENAVDSDFDYEETGAAAGDLNSNDKYPPNDLTVSPSLREMKNSKGHSKSKKNSKVEPYDDSDVLVQQLFEVRFNEPPSKTTRSLSDQNSEYLITSTHIPY